MLFILTAGMVPTIGVAALPSYKNGTMTSARTVYCLPIVQNDQKVSNIILNYANLRR